MSNMKFNPATGNDTYLCQCCGTTYDGMLYAPKWQQVPGTQREGNVCPYCQDKSLEVETATVVISQKLGRPIMDDGQRCVVPGYEVVCYTTEGDMYVHYHFFDIRSRAELLVANVKTAGRINTQHWTKCTNITDELPDYVTDPRNPMFN